MILNDKISLFFKKKKRIPILKYLNKLKIKVSKSNYNSHFLKILLRTLFIKFNFKLILSNGKKNSRNNLILN